MSLTHTRAPRVLEGWHVLVAFLLFFGADIAVNVVFIARAYQTFPGEVSSTPYEDGLAYDQSWRQRQAQKALGWKLTAGLVASDRLRVTLVDARGAPIEGLRVSALMQRPATVAGAKTVTLAAVAPGAYEAFAGLATGAWDIDITCVEPSGRKFLATTRILKS